LEIRGDRLIEKDENQKYQEPNRFHQVPVTLSSVKCRRPHQNITLELRSAGPLIGLKNPAHSIEVTQTKIEQRTTKYEEVRITHDASFCNNENEVQQDERKQNSDPYTAQADEELLSLRRKHMPTTTL